MHFLQEVSKKKGKGKADEEAHGILEGISSLHSWIKTQTMIRPTKLGKKKDDMSFDDVGKNSKIKSVLSVCSRMMMRMLLSPFPQRILKHVRVWLDLTTPRENMCLLN